MSRIGRKIIKIPEGVKVTLADGVMTVSGSRGSLTRSIPPEVSVKIDESGILVGVGDQLRKTLALWGLYRNLLANMVEGAAHGFQKELELSGIGFKVKKDGEGLVLSLGFSHPIKYSPQAGISFEVKEDNKLIISGIDRELIGQEAAKIRSLKKPEPYKGKGIKYPGEIIRRKAGKVGKVGATLGGK